jgi:UDP-GlcNAc:undecaprenyl-phosphate GlcNAc-1-phosphate transferase
MTTALVAYGFAFVIGVAATLGVRFLAQRLGIVDRPDGYRKLHRRKVPLLGGVAIYLAFAAPLVGLYFYRNAISTRLYSRTWPMLALMGGGAVALGLGVIDDVRKLRPRWKLLGQTVAGTIAFAGGYSILAIGHPFGRPLALGYLSYPVTLFWFLACMNAVNLLDGLDGLAAGVSLLACVTLFLASLLFGNTLSMVLMACLCGAILSFLLFNFFPATIFLGDSGTMLVGYLVAAISLLSARQPGASVFLLVPVLALGVPVFDTALAVARRWFRKLPISAADRRHIHHVLLAMGFSQRQVVVVLYGACLLLGGMALLLASKRGEMTLLVLVPLAVAVFAAVRIFGGIRFIDYWRELRQRIAAKQRSADARVAVDRATSRMRRSSGLGELWQECGGALEGMGIDHASLRLFGDGAAATYRWHNEPAEGGRRSGRETGRWSAVIRLGVADRTLGELTLSKRIRATTLLCDAPELVEALSRELAGQLIRISAPKREPIIATRPEELQVQRRAG